MLRRVAILVVLASVLIPASAAQATLHLTAEWAHAEATLPESGRSSVPIIVKAKLVGNTGCGQAQTFDVDLKLASFPKWAGASLLPPKVSFVLDQGPHAGEKALPDQEAELELAWDLEDAPRFDARNDYVVNMRSDDVTRSGGPCMPDVRVEASDSAPVAVTLPDRPVEEAPDCTIDPAQEKCITTSATPSPPAPSAGPLVSLLVVAAAVLLRRRRR